MNDYRLDRLDRERGTGLPVHTPVPYSFVEPVPHGPAPVVQASGHDLAQVQTVQLPDGRVVSGYVVGPAPVEPQPQPQLLNPVTVNIAVGSLAFAAVCGGLFLLTSFIVALAALLQQLVILAAVIFGGWIAVQVLRQGAGKGGGTTINAKKAVFKNSTFRS